MQLDAILHYASAKDMLLMQNLMHLS